MKRLINAIPPEVKLSYKPIVMSQSLSYPENVYDFLMKVWDKSKITIQEQVYAIFVNRQNEVICWKCLNTGTSNRCLVDIKTALCIAVNCLADKMFIAHNHPSGKLQPSTEDLMFTNDFYKACKLMSVTLLDHLIVSNENFYSFANNRHIIN